MQKNGYDLDDEATRLEYLMQFYYEGYPAEDITDITD